MSEAFVGEIRVFSFGYAPVGWLQCNGQQVPISGNEALFTLIGKTYGGDGVTNFAVPNLNGRVPVHLQTSTTSPFSALGTQVGSETVTLTANQLGQHVHPLLVSDAQATSGSPVGNVMAQTGSENTYANTANATMNAGVVGSSSGGGQPHNNLQPYTVVNYCICQVGTFPPQP